MNTYLNVAEPLIHLIVEHEVAVMLPKNIPILQAFATKNWTYPDNVFCTKNMANSLIHCYTDSSHQGPHTDHVPIPTVLDLEIPPRQKPPQKTSKMLTGRDLERPSKPRSTMYPHTLQLYPKKSFNEWPNSSQWLSKKLLKPTYPTQDHVLTPTDGGTVTSPT